MEPKRSLADLLFYHSHRDYTREEGNVRYLDGSALARPFRMPAAARVVVLALVAVAIVAGAVFMNRTVLASARAAESQQQAVEANLARENSLQTLPLMNMVINLDDQGIVNLFAQYGYVIYDATSSNTNGDLTLYKLPSDVPLDDAAKLAGGIGSLNAADASKLLQGSWFFTADRGDETSMVVRYADFDSHDPQVAVQNALAKQGFDETTVAESGVDDIGNTYTMGNMEVDGVPCTWRISAIALSDVYDISGLPEDALYVGVRITK